MQQQKSKSKGNPASKRMSNTALETRRHNSWLRCQERKARLRKEALLAQIHRPGTWERAKAARYARRHPGEMAA